MSISLEAYILHGTPGSGKSTRAIEIANEYAKGDIEGKSYEIISTDKYWLDENNEYKFNINLLGDAHNWAFREWHDACHEGITLLILDNTNIQRKEWENYAHVASYCGYDVNHISFKPENIDQALEWNARGLHYVPDKTVINMFNRWEDAE